MAITRRERGQSDIDFRLIVCCPNVVCVCVDREISIIAPLGEVYLCSACGTQLMVSPE